MGLFDIFRKKPKTLADLLDASPAFQQQKALFEAMNAMCEAGIDVDEFAAGYGEFGLVATNPVPCNTILGSRRYLASLRTEKNEAVSYSRIGSTSSPISPLPLDIYELSLPNGGQMVIYISPYQRRNSNRAPSGLLLK